MASGKFVAYYRVSTDRQGKSGLGLDAQRQAVTAFLNGGSWELSAEFTEIESGKRNARPELLKALDTCRKIKATLIIAKLDRLSRDAGFLMTLRGGKVDVRAADMPEAGTLEFGIRAVFAQHEREEISKRTKAALAAAKARGQQLGWSHPDRVGQQLVAARKGALVNAHRAAEFAANVLPIIDAIREAGITTLTGIAAALNARGIRTARGGTWHPATVRNILRHHHDGDVARAA